MPTATASKLPLPLPWLGALTTALNQRAGNDSVRPPVRVRGAHLLGGTTVRTWQLTTDRGPLFAKTGPAKQRFDTEAAGLRALAEAAAKVGGPATAFQPVQVLAEGRFADPIPAGGDEAFLVLEWLTLRDSPDATAWAVAGQALATLHAAGAPLFGWDREGTIGAAPQTNTPEKRWSTFWREHRLKSRFALLRADAAHDAVAARVLQPLLALEAPLCQVSDALLAGYHPAPSILHGDLWRGNIGFNARGKPVLIDPAVHFGDAETDLAMAHLFGGLPPAFFSAYDAVRTPRPGYVARRALYQLYHLLNHAHLFGGGYIDQSRETAERLIAQQRAPG
jgi:fructosamine-3-kinase